MLIYSLPLEASKERVRLWRKLKQLGSVALKNSVYILPYAETFYENFQWLKQEVQTVHGEATLLKVNRIEGMSNEEIVKLFTEGRNQDYAQIIGDCEGLIRRLRKLPQKGSSIEQDIIFKELHKIRQRLKLVGEIDFFNASLRTQATRLLEQCEKKLKGNARDRKGKRLLSLTKKDFTSRKWVTRPRPHVDRLASAWLIRRFIDPKAKFIFASEKEIPKDATPFDMLGAELSHRGEDCTFETLVKASAIKDKTVWEIAKIVHDVDLRDEKYGMQEAKGIELMLRGLMKTHTDDQSLLEAGINLFETLYKGLKK
ncbi:MAG: chromate resistance protein ChrB domain-containing protein [Candidatus Brocadiales bacterium]